MKTINQNAKIDVKLHNAFEFQKENLEINASSCK